MTIRQLFHRICLLALLAGLGVLVFTVAERVFPSWLHGEEAAAVNLWHTVSVSSRQAPPTDPLTPAPALRDTLKAPVLAADAVVQDPNAPTTDTVPVSASIAVNALPLAPATKVVP